MASYDGTSKSSEGKGQDIHYWEITTPYMEKIRQEAIANASPEALRALDPLNYQGPSVVVDASTLTNEEWLAMRQDSIGASEVSQIFGECPYPDCTNIDLYNRKIGVAPKMMTSDEDEEDKQRKFLYGHLMEEYLHLITKQKFPNSKLIIDTNTYADPKRGFLTANLDGMMQLSDGSYVHIEYKTTSEFGEDAYANDSIPPHYKRQLIQCQHIMGVYVSYLIVAFSRDNIIVRKYVRDLDEEYEQVVRAEEFWTHNILPQIQPDPKGPAKNLISSLKKFSGYGDKSLPEKTLDRGLMSAASQLYEKNEEIKRLNAQLKILQEQKEKLMVPLVEAMGQRTKGYITDGKEAFSVSFAPRAGAQKCDFDRLKLHYPDIYSRYVTRSAEGSRPMSVKRTLIK